MTGRLAVLVSGSGTNLQALLDDPKIRPNVVLVLSDRPGVKALERATEARVATSVVAPEDFAEAVIARERKRDPNDPAEIYQGGAFVTAESVIHRKFETPR